VTENCYFTALIVWNESEDESSASASVRVYFNVQFYTRCAVLNPFVQFLKHKCAVTKLTKVALKQSSHLLVTLVDAP
jgi:hypothetical protein